MGVFKDHLVGNVHDMDPYVLEVGHRVFEVLVDDVCGNVAGPFACVRYDVVEMDIEIQ